MGSHTFYPATLFLEKWVCNVNVTPEFLIASPGAVEDHLFKTAAPPEAITETVVIDRIIVRISHALDMASRGEPLESIPLIGVGYAARK